MADVSEKLGRQRIALVAATWHGELVEIAVRACRNVLAEGGVSEDDLEEFRVPGSFELPLLVRRLAASARYDAVVAFGLVVDGGIYRHEFVANAVIDGLMRVMLDTDVSVFSSVLTPQQFHEHDTHAEFFGRHLEQKGGEVAQAVLRAMEIYRTLPQSTAA